MKIIARTALAFLLLSLLGLGVTTGPAHAAGIAASGYSATDFATGFYTTGGTNGCCGPIGLAFDSSSQLWVMDYPTGTLYKFGASGGTAGTAAQVGPGIGGSVAGITFSKSGRLYAAWQGNGTVVELSTTNGSVVRTIASVPCPTGIATDPLSGDLFVTSSGCASVVYRISNPDSATPTTSVYADYGGTDGITFGPDGTLYTTTNGCAYEVTGTNGPATPVATPLSCVPSMDGIADAASPNPSQPPYIFTNDNDGTITKIDLTTSPYTQTQIVTGGTRGDFVAVGPDGCLYATQTATIEKVTNADGTCSFAPTGAVPQISLTSPTAPTVPVNTGSSVTLTATFDNISPSGGTPVNWAVTGANPQTATTDTNAGGTATFTYTGTNPGTDTVTASATVNGTPLTSNPQTVTWQTPPDTTPPSTTLAPTPSSPNGSNGWYTSQPSVALSATDPDNGSGITTYYSVDNSACGSPLGSTTGCTTYSGSFSLTDGSHTVYYFSVDPAGNAETQKSQAVEVDTTAPAISIASPTSGSSYFVNQVVASSYSCSDGGSGVATCAGPVASGGNIDTSSVGSKSFTVNSSDVAGNSSSQTVNYTVAYDVGSSAPAACVLYDPTKANNAGSTIPIKLELCDANGTNLSSSAITLTATGLAPSRGNANPGGTFRYDSTLGSGGGYIYNLDTTGYSSGTYELQFTVSGDPTVHQTQFVIK